MTSRTSHLTYNLLLAALLISLLAIGPAMAAMTLTGVIYRQDVVPGTTISFPMTLSTAAADAAGDYEVTVLGFLNGANGGYQGIDPAQDTGAYSARPFIVLDKTAVHIAPGGKEVITATIKVPSTGAGGRYALINIRPKQVVTTGGGASFTTAMNVPIMITLTGTQLTETGTIGSVSAGTIVSGKPVEITTVFTNTGNHHFYGAKNEIVVADGTGKEVARSATTPSVTAIVPGGSVEFTRQITTALSPGTYSVTSKIFDSKETVLDTKTTTFTLAEASAAPAPASSVKQAPGVPGTVAVPVAAGSPAAGAAGTPVAKTTYSPVSVTTIVLALGAVGSLFLMGKKF